MKKLVKNINIHRYLILYKDNGVNCSENIFALNEYDAVLILSDKHGKDLSDSIISITLDDFDSSISIDESNESRWIVTCMLKNGDSKSISIVSGTKEDANKFAQQLIRKYSQTDSEWDGAEVNSIEPKDLLEGECIGMRIRKINDNMVNNEQEFGDMREEFNLGELDDTPFVIVSDKDDTVDGEKELKKDAPPAINMSIVSLINGLIVDEFEAIEGYNSAVTTISDVSPNSEVIAILRDIASEENKHVGQLQRLLSLVSDDASEMGIGYKEADRQIKEIGAPMTQQCDISNRGELHPVFHSTLDKDSPLQINVSHENQVIDSEIRNACRDIDDICTLAYDEIDDTF